MTVSSTTNSVQYSGTGSVSAYPVPFVYLDKAHVVVRRTVLGVTTQLVLGTHYTLTAVRKPEGGTLTLTTPLPTGATLVVERVVPSLQPASLTTQGAFNPRTIEDELDKGVMWQQQEERARLVLEGRATVLEEDVASLDERTHALEEDSTSLKGRATALEAGTTSLDGRAYALESDVLALDTRTGTLEAGVLALDSRTDNLEGQSSEMSAELYSLTDRTVAVEAGLTAMDTRVDALEALPPGGGGGGSSQWTSGAGGDISYTGGDVGVGVADPLTKLHVRHTPGTQGQPGPFLRVENGTGGVNATAGIDVTTYAPTGGGGPSARILAVDNGLWTSTLQLQTKQSGNMSNALVDRLTIDTDGDVAIARGLTVDSDTLVVDAATGRVGVNTPSPTSPLTVTGTTTVNGMVSSIVSSGNTGLSVSNGVDSTLQISPTGSGQVRVRTDSASRWMSFADGAGTTDVLAVRNGRVGIGNNNPAAGQVLDVTGNARVSGNVSATATGSTEAAPRTIGIESIGSGTAARIQFGDAYNAWQLGYSRKMQMYAYYGIEIHGARQSATALAFAAGAGSDASLKVVARTPTALGLEVVGRATVSDSLTVDGASSMPGGLTLPAAPATVGTPLVDSPGVTLRGAAWSGSASVTPPEFKLYVDSQSTTGSRLVVNCGGTERISFNSPSGDMFPLTGFGANIGSNSLPFDHVYAGGVHLNYHFDLSSNVRVDLSAKTNQQRSRLAAADALVCHELRNINALTNPAAKLLRVCSDDGTTERLSVNLAGKLTLNATDASGTPGDCTINTPSGKAAVAAGATACVVTNSNVTVDSIVQVTALDLDGTLTHFKAVPAAGSFTLTGNATATAAFRFAFTVFN